MLTGSVPLVSWAQEPVLLGQWIVLLDTTALLAPRAPPSTPVLGALSESVLVEEASKTVDLAPQGTSAWIQVTRLSYHSLTIVLSLATGLAQKGRKKVMAWVWSLVIIEEGNGRGHVDKGPDYSWGNV